MKTVIQNPIDDVDGEMPLEVDDFKGSYKRICAEYARVLAERDDLAEALRGLVSQIDDTCRIWPHEIDRDGTFCRVCGISLSVNAKRDKDGVITEYRSDISCARTALAKIGESK